MAQRGKPSIAHVFDKRDCCVYCDMYRVNVEQMNHVCKPWRENQVDAIDAEKLGQSVEEYRAGVTPSQTT